MPLVVRAVVVTGASTGIGEAVALRFDRRGWQVFAGVRREADAERLTRQAGSRLRTVMLDVTDEQMVGAAADTIRSAVGPGGLAGVVNNAGVALGGPVEFLPLDEWRRQLEVNVIGQIAVTKAVLPMIRQGRGRIVFIGSISGRVAAPMMGPYSASKFALAAIAETLRHELRPWGIRVVLIEPGAIKTAIWDKGRRSLTAAHELLPAEALEVYRGHLEELKRVVEHQDRAGIPAETVASVVERALLARRPRARYLVGPDARAGGVMSRVLPDSLKDEVLRRLSP